MAATLEDRKLWVALSDVFVDAAVEQRLIARAVKQYSLAQIEIVFFEQVAPVCISNIMTTVPPVIWGFDEDQLVQLIEELIDKRSQYWVFGRMLFRVKVWLIRLVLFRVWVSLRNEITKLQCDA